VIGVLVGLVSGYFGGWLDRILVLLADAIYAFPSLLLAILLAIFAAPLSLAAVMVRWSLKRGPLEEPEEWPRWAAVGAAMFTGWAVSYLLISRVPEPEKVLYLSAELESHISLRPAYALLYVLLYPIFLLPYFVVRERSVLRRLVIANLIMIVGSSVCFVGCPVGVARPPLPEQMDLGVWVLRQVWGTDAPWNCMPSEHCMAAMIATLACWESDRRVGAFAFLATFAIGLSTLFTKQHYLVDVVVGFTLGIGLYAVLRWRASLGRQEKPSPEPGIDISAAR